MPERVTLGIGDDTASFLPRPGQELLVTCDCLEVGKITLRVKSDLRGRRDPAAHTR